LLNGPQAATHQFRFFAQNNKWGPIIGSGDQISPDEQIATIAVRKTSSPRTTTRRSGAASECSGSRGGYRRENWQSTLACPFSRCKSTKTVATALGLDGCNGSLRYWEFPSRFSYEG
jgi:hypothetical protein